MTVAELKNGDRVIFEQVPNGSYLSTGKLYQVEAVNSREIYFRSQTGSGTFETKRALATSATFYRASC